MERASPTDSRPLYHRIAAVLRGEITSGRLGPGARLPTIASLAGSYAVAPVTVRQALGLLTEEGLVRARQGSGTFVTQAPPPAPQLALDAGWPQLAASIRGNTARILVAWDATALQQKLRPGEGHAAAAYRYMERVHSDPSGRPYAHSRIHVARRYYDLAPARFDREMVLALLEEVAGAELPELRQSFSIAAADIVTAEALGLPVGVPVGHMRRVVKRADGEIAYFSIGHYRADSVSFEAVLRRSGSDTQ
ncbi:GntR family transcriptional regulator [Roseomonas frigidaquae]|uniref:GntR family transcriptional regulator n=1 Tax=Falsiroseomonas frigidaquae TaxID=487318 RepID=A0ABX1F4X9_9PROT|nr:GntR family transcriptional regulator [Falsiroseomonas frigidaquae]NKE47362.1 GntR family transcriptional regulator [Falsiroseomonas frigidaquae]